MTFRALDEQSDASVSAQRFTSIDLPGGQDGLVPLYISPDGVIVGRYLIAGATHGFVRSLAGDFTTVDFPGASLTVASGLNTRGDLLGWYILPSAPKLRHAFLFRNGAYTTFDPPGSTFTNAIGMDDQGSVVGRFCILDSCRLAGRGDFRAFLLRDGVYHYIDFPGAAETDAWKFNSRGQIVGSYVSDDGKSHIFVLQDGEFTSMDLPSGLTVSDDNGGINARGDVVGLACDAAPCDFAPTGTHGFVANGDHFARIDYPGATATGAFANNDRGDVVGYYFDAHGIVHGFLLSAVD